MVSSYEINGQKDNESGQHSDHKEQGGSVEFADDEEQTRKKLQIRDEDGRQVYGKIGEEVITVNRLGKIPRGYDLVI